LSLRCSFVSEGISISNDGEEESILEGSQDGGMSDGDEFGEKYVFPFFLFCWLILVLQLSVFLFVFTSFCCDSWAYVLSRLTG
jgi:hypothetical protein